MSLSGVLNERKNAFARKKCMDFLPHDRGLLKNWTGYNDPEKGGKPLWITTTSAKGNERVQALTLLDQLQISGCKDTQRMTICGADKGYDADELRMAMLRRSYVPIIGYRKHRKGRVKTEDIYAYFRASKKDGWLKGIFLD